MRTRARAWAVRAAVVAVVTTAGVVGISAPAHAAPIITNFILSTNRISPGQTVTATWTVRTDKEDGEVVNVSVQANNNANLQCDGDCNVVGAEISPDGRDFEARFEATGTVTSDQSLQIRVRAGNVESSPQPLTIEAPAQQVPEVRGMVTDLLTGEPIEGARVSMTDSAGTTWDNIGTDSSGRFTIPGTSQKPIAAGMVQFTVRKDGFQELISPPFQANAGVALTNVPLKIQAAAPSASATASPSLTASGSPTGSAAGTSAAAAPPDEGLSGFSILLIVIGAVLVLAGIAAIVLLFIRRNKDEDGGPPRGAPGRGGPGRGGPPGPRRPGPPDRTQPMRPGYGPPRPGAPGSRDQTVISRSPLADAPTQMHGRPGAPQPPYSGPPAPPYSGPPAYPPQPPGPPAGYPQQPGYGQPRPGPGGYGDPRQAGRHTSEGRRVDWMDD